MKLRVAVEDRVYEVDVETGGAGTASPEGTRARPAVPESVLRRRLPQRLPEDSVVRSPIAGRVIAVLAVAGEKIRRHQGVVLLDAMKMEVPIGPAVDGTLQAVHVAAGDAVATGQALFKMAP